MTTPRDALRRGRAALVALADEASDDAMALTCVPPPPGRPARYGDLVPLGFVLRALAEAPGSAAAAAAALLRTAIGERRRGVLWPYHSGGLTTATDSALVLLGYTSTAAVAGLERFADVSGGYLPQLCSERPEEGKMPIDPYHRHWCQPDYGTTCAVVAARRSVGLDVGGRLNYLRTGLATRSALYFANPYLVDWLLAMAVADEDGHIGDAVAAELLAARNADGSFGRYDIAMSTAFAVLAMAALGVAGEPVDVARRYLAASVERDGRWPVATPFYSSIVVPAERFAAGDLLGLAVGDRDDQVVMVDGEVHAITWYVDDVRMITTAAAVLALSVPIGVPTRSQASPAVHPRYRTASIEGYVADFALPPYAGGGPDVPG